jgi:hypothetical protein
MIENDGPKIDPKQAVDLAEVRRRAEEAELVEAAEEARRREQEMVAWFAAMKRAFRGVGGVKHRDRILAWKRAIEKAEREDKPLWVPWVRR